MTKGEIKSALGICGCHECEHFVEITDGKAPYPWRQYCGLGNFNLNTAGYKVLKTSHNKSKISPDANYDWDYAISNRCPLLKKDHI